MKILSVFALMFSIISCSESQSVSSADNSNTTEYSDALLIDVRTEGEFNQGSPQGAINIPVDNIETEQDLLPEDKNQKIVVFCLSGGRSSHAKVILEEMGYTQVTNGGTYKDVERKVNESVQEEAN